MMAATVSAAPASVDAHRVRIVGRRPEPNREAARRAVTDLLIALGRDPADVHLAETPSRVADAYAELLTPNRST